MAGIDESGLLRERLRATLDHVGLQRETEALRYALSLADGFSLFLAVCNTTRLASGLQLWLEQAVARERGATMVRVSPFPLDPSAAGPTELGASELVASVFEGLSVAGSQERVAVLDLARAQTRDGDVWRELLFRLNERRNSLGSALGCALVLIVPPWLSEELGRLAPDFWSIRTMVVVLRDLDTAPAGELSLRTYEATQWRNTTPVDEIREQVAEVREQASVGTPSSQRALVIALLRLGGVLELRGQWPEAIGVVDEATQLAERLADLPMSAACWLARADLSWKVGDYPRAQELAEVAIAALRKENDPWTLANAWDRLATVLLLQGKLDDALRILREEALPTYDRLGDEHARAVTMGKVAGILQARGELDEALRIRREEELPVYEKLGDVRGRALAMGRVADILQARGEFDEVLRIRRMEELPVFEKLGDVQSLLVARANLAITLARRGQDTDRSESAELLASALRDARKLRSRDLPWIASKIRSLGWDPDAPPFSDRT